MARTDMQALDSAFADLNARGVLTFPNFYCCGGCASGGVFNAHKGDPQESTVGAVYFHAQDAEAALDGHGLALRYGGLGAYEMATSGQDRAIGELLVEALRKHGLEVDWNGDPGMVVKVTRFEATLDEMPRGEESDLHETYGVEDDDEGDDDDWGDNWE